MLRDGRRRLVLLLGVLALVAAACGGGRQEATGGGGEGAAAPGITDDSIKLGGSYPLSGPASAYGVIARGVQAYFESVNAEGGVEMGDGQTRRIEFVFYDDGYAPPRMVENARRLIEQDQVFALFNTLGTPTNTAIIDYVNQREVPHLFVATGASKWGADTEQYPWTMGWQPAYPTEAAIYAEYLKQQKPDATVAILYQNDDFGEDYLVGFREAIEGSDIRLIAEESYQVTDPSADAQVTNLSRSGADAFINITTPKFAAQSIARMAALGWKPQFHFLTSVSQSIESVIKPAGPQNAVDIITSVYLKEPSDPQWAEDPAMVEYKENAEQYGDFEPNDPFGVYGFAVADSLVKGVLERMEEPTREAMMEAARSIDDVEVGLLLPGINLSTAEDDGFPIETMQLARFGGTEWDLFGDPISYEGETPLPRH